MFMAIARASGVWSVGRAVILSILIPGLGQIYEGERTRGAGILLSVCMTSLVVAWYGVWIWLVTPLAVWLWGVWDAARAEHRSVVIPTVTIFFMSYAIGWRVAEIDFSVLTHNVSRAAVVLGPMVRPNLIEARAETQRAFVTIEVPCSENPPSGQRTYADLELTASAGCGQVGDVISVTGSGFWPEIDSEIWWEDAIGEKLHILEKGRIVKVKTDAHGGFVSMVVIPQMRSGTGQEANLDEPLPERFIVIQKRPIGGYKITENGIRVANGILETLSLALVATTFALFGALPLGFLAARNLMDGSAASLAVYYGIRTVMSALRSIEPLIMAIVFVVIVGLGPFAGMLAIMVHSVAALAKLYSESIEAIDPGPINAIWATGARWSEVVRYGVIPQAMPSFISYTLYRWDINVRSSIIVGFVGGGGIGAWLFQWIVLADYRAVGASFVAIVLVVMALDYGSARLRERIV